MNQDMVNTFIGELWKSHQALEKAVFVATQCGGWKRDGLLGVALDRVLKDICKNLQKLSEYMDTLENEEHVDYPVRVFVTDRGESAEDGKRFVYQISIDPDLVAGVMRL